MKPQLNKLRLAGLLLTKTVLQYRRLKTNTTPAHDKIRRGLLFFESRL
jgi:uncharacterized membrane protein affecting hemolysin expression